MLGVPKNALAALQTVQLETRQTQGCTHMHRTKCTRQISCSLIVMKSSSSAKYLLAERQQYCHHRRQSPHREIHLQAGIIKLYQLLWLFSPGDVHWQDHVCLHDVATSAADVRYVYLSL